MLEATELNKGRPLKKGFHDGTVLPTLSDLDTTKKESHRVQLISFLPDDVFETYIAETLSPDELTTAGALRLARKLQQVEVEPPPLPEGKYNVIYADPPWQYSNAGLGGAELVPYIEGHAQLIRGQRVMLDRDLAKVYGVETRRLNEQRERNPEKFPEDFAFQFTPDEISQNAMLERMQFTHPPWAYTLEGCNMAATVLNTPKAIKRSVTIIRTFSDLERMAHGEEPKQPGFAEFMQMIGDVILCSPFQVYFAPEKAGGGFEIRLPDAPRSNVNDFWILLIVLHRARARMRLSSLLACALPLAFSPPTITFCFRFTFCGPHYHLPSGKNPEPVFPHPFPAAGLFFDERKQQKYRLRL